MNAQLAALRIENRHLRQAARQTTESSRDMKSTEKQLNELQNAYQTSIQVLEVK